MVNRIWQQHFCRGIVETPSDFGRNGARPTHPELLDWLALRFVEEKWSIKAMHRLMLTSNTYRQAAENPARTVIHGARVPVSCRRTRAPEASDYRSVQAASPALDLQGRRGASVRWLPTKCAG
jgi:hypothetical protein